MCCFFFALMACQQTPPVPLPPTQRETWAPRGRLVSASGGLQGYLVKPRQTPASSTLLLVEQLNDDSRAAADRLARRGEIVLAVDADTPTERASDYLLALPDTRGTATTCLRQEGC
jgi:hypothetical protein